MDESKNKTTTDAKWKKKEPKKCGMKCNEEKHILQTTKSNWPTYSFQASKHMASIETQDSRMWKVKVLIPGVHCNAMVIIIIVSFSMTIGKSDDGIGTFVFVSMTNQPAGRPVCRLDIIKSSLANMTHHLSSTPLVEHVKPTPCWSELNVTSAILW